MTIKVCTPKIIKAAFYDNSVKDIKKVFKSRTFQGMNVIIKDVYDDTQHIEVIVRAGNFITHGCEDGHPWTEAYDTPKLFEKMAEIGFTPSYFQVETIEKKGNKDNDNGQYLNIGFTKKVPKKEALKI